MDFMESSPLILTENAMDELQTHANLNLEYYKDIQVFSCFIISFKLTADSLICRSTKRANTKKKVMQ